jgi:uncharacterized protein
MRVWIDLSNSPHALLFEPLVADLRAAGHEPLLTARDHAQTAELARERFAQVEIVGAPSPPGRLAKSRSLAARVAALARWARRRSPDVALSHNSYAQLVVARALRIPAVTAMDFEHQPANHLAFRAARRILVPEVVAAAPQLRRQGARASKLIAYPGFKEEIYLGERRPDPGVVVGLGAEPPPGGALVVARSAPAGAAYHPGENPLFERCILALEEQDRVRTVVLARHPEQRSRLLGLGLERTLVPAEAVDATSLLQQADLFLGAGGTMSREAALLGARSLSLFAGRRPAVDAELERRGLLGRLSDPAQLAELQPRPGGAGERRREQLRAAGARIRELFVDALSRVGAP